MDSNFWQSMLIAVAAAAMLFFFGLALFAVWMGSIAIASAEGRDGMALFLTVLMLYAPLILTGSHTHSSGLAVMLWGFFGVVLGALASTVFLLRNQRYRQVAWIGKFLLGGLVALGIFIEAEWRLIP